MTNAIRFLMVGIGLATLSLAGTHASSAPPKQEVKPAIVLTDAEKEAVKEFDKRTKSYAALHEKLNATLPRLPKKATPEQIAEHQKSMTALIRKERKTAKPGDFFSPGMVALVKRASRATVEGWDDQEVKKAVMAENPGTLPNVSVNDRYPDAAPIASMPVELLETLPKLPDGQEYRFLGKRLVLVDACCQLVLDITPDVLT